MSLSDHRIKESLGGVVYLLTIDMREITGDPTHVLRITNTYGEDGTGVIYQGVQYTPHPYEISQINKTSKDNKTPTKISLSNLDNDLKLSRFIDRVGGNLAEGRVYELKVFGVFLDNGDEPDTLAYSKTLDHIIEYHEESNEVFGELVINTINPLSKGIQIPFLTFSAGVPNSTDSAINVFPAVDRSVTGR